MANSNEFTEAICKAVERMTSQGVLFERGLLDSEIALSEERFEIRFPPDLKAFLQNALPIGFQRGNQPGAFPNWRSGDEMSLRNRLNWPFEGLAFDIENNTFWLDEWGLKPNNVPEAIAVARRHVNAAPKLIPVFGHRYIPQEPQLAGNPVLSVHQTDIICYGQNLWDYFEQEFGLNGEGWYAGQRYSNWSKDEYYAAHRHVRFWSDLAS